MVQYCFMLYPSPNENTSITSKHQKPVVSSSNPRIKSGRRKPIP